MDTAVIEEVEIYVLHRQNTISQYIATHPILDLCLLGERGTVNRVTQQCLKQEYIDLEVWKSAVREVEAEE